MVISKTNVPQWVPYDLNGKGYDTMVCNRLLNDTEAFWHDNKRCMCFLYPEQYHGLQTLLSRCVGFAKQHRSFWMTTNIEIALEAPLNSTMACMAPAGFLWHCKAGLQKSLCHFISFSQAWQPNLFMKGLQVTFGLASVSATVQRSAQRNAAFLDGIKKHF